MRRGFVLVLVLFALVLLAALASAGFFEALQELRIGRNSDEDVRLESAAESGPVAALAGWDPRDDTVSANGSPLRLPGLVAAGLVTSVDVRRLSDRLLLLRSSATDEAGTTRTVEQVARLTAPETPPAAVRARVVDGVIGARADGTDRNPAGWNCPTASGVVQGVKLEPNASDSAFFSFGPMDWRALIAWAAAVPRDGDSLPVVYQPGDFSLDGGRWLGTLVVGGDLVLRGGVQVLGLLLVRGTLRIGPGGGAVLGQVVASQVNVDQQVMPQEVSFGYSSCSAVRAALARALPRPLPGLPAWGVF